MNKYKKVVLFVFLIILILCNSSCSIGPVKHEDKTIKIGILNTPNDVAVARKAGYLKQSLPGYKIKYIVFDSGVDANKALMTNSIDFATMGDTNALVALTRNIPAKLFFINEICQTNEELVVKKDLKINNPKELANKKIATPFASTSHLSLLYILDKYKLRNKVTVLDMDTQNIVAAWKRNQIDAAYTWEPTLSELRKTGSIIVNSKDLMDEGMLTGNVTLVSDKFAKEHNKECCIIKKQLLKANNLRNKNEHKAIKLAAKQVNISCYEAKEQMLSTYWLNEKEEENNLKVCGNFLNAMKKAGYYMHKNQNLEYSPDNKQLYKFVWSGWKNG